MKYPKHELTSDLAKAIISLKTAKEFCVSATGQDYINRAMDILWQAGEKSGADIITEMRKIAVD